MANDNTRSVSVDIHHLITEEQAVFLCVHHLLQAVMYFEATPIDIQPLLNEVCARTMGTELSRPVCEAFIRGLQKAYNSVGC